MAATTGSPKPSKGVRAITDHAHEIGMLLRAKLMAQLTPDQRDLLRTCEDLLEINDAVFADDPSRVVRHVPRNLTHARIAAEAKHGEWLLTGCDWRELYEEDRTNSEARLARAGLVD